MIQFIKYLLVFFLMFDFCFIFASTKTNPDISVGLLMMARKGPVDELQDSEKASGFFLQEAEIMATSNIDPYWRGTLVLAFHRESGEEEYGVEPEEAFVDSLSIPSLTVRAGRFKPYLGKHNQLHLHAFPFVDPPMIYEYMLGGEGMVDNGVALSYLLPVSWFSELTVQALDGENSFLFTDNKRSDELVHLVHYMNLWDFSDESTLELTLSSGAGMNQEKGNTTLHNASLTYKWRPLKYSSSKKFSWTTEYMTVDRKKQITSIENSGFSTWMIYQFSKRWTTQVRYGQIATDDDRGHKNSILIGYIPTEFSGIRLQYDSIKEPGNNKTEEVISLQLNVSMGTHPAHLY